MFQFYSMQCWDLIIINTLKHRYLERYEILCGTAAPPETFYNPILLHKLDVFKEKKYFGTAYNFHNLLIFGRFCSRTANIALEPPK